MSLISESLNKNRWENGIAMPVSKGIGSDSVAAASSASRFGQGLSNYNQVNQAEHFRGHVFSAVNPIAKRAMSFELNVARVTTGVRASKSVGRMARNSPAYKKGLPSHVKMRDLDSLEIVTDHPLITAMQNPNDLMVSSQMLYITAVSLCVIGRCYWSFSHDEDGKPEIIPIPPTWVKPKPSRDKENSERFVIDYEVKPPGIVGNPELVPHNEMAVFFNPDPFDPIGCLSQLQMQAQTVLADEAIARSQYLSFKQGINPGYALILGDEMLKDADGNTYKERPRLSVQMRNRMMTFVRQEFQGLEKHGLPIILDKLFHDIKKLTNTPAEMDFQNSAESTKSNIYEGFGVSPLIAGQVEGANRASSAIADHHLIANTMNPMGKMLGEVITASVLPYFSTDGEYIAWFSSLDSYDPEMEMKRMQVGVTSNSLTRNEIRTFLNLPGLDGFDDTPQEHRAKLLPANTQQAGGDSTVPSKKKSRTLSKAKREAFATEWVKSVTKEENKVADSVGVGVKKVYQVIAKAIEDNEPSTESQAKKVMKAAIKKTGVWEEFVKKEMPAILARPMLVGVDQDLAATREYIKEATKKSHNPSATKDTADDLISEFHLDLPAEYMNQVELEIERFIEQDYWADISDTTVNEMMNVFRDGLVEGLSAKEIAKSISASFNQFGVNQALRIARTETTNVMNAGHRVARQDLMDAGMIVGQEWLTIGDDDVRETHQEMSGVKIDNDEQFVVGGISCDWPGDIALTAKERIHCRCTTVSVFSDKLLAA